MKIYQDLVRLEEKGSPIKIGLVGAGQMGTDIVSQIGQMKGIEVPVIADVNIENAVRAYQICGNCAEDITRSNQKSALEEALFKGKNSVTEDSQLLPLLDGLDVIIDATGVPEVGASIGLNSILNNKHIIMMNVEADVCIGHILNRMADKAGVIYSGAAGDEPAAIMELYDFAKSMGFGIVAAGKGKNNPLDRTANPDTLRETAVQKGTSADMLTCFVDGTKTMVEMTAVSNATGLVPDVPGMHGPQTDISNLPGKFSLKSMGGILSQEGVVDYALGNVAPGVFVVINSDNQRVVDSLKYSKMGPGPNFVLYRPYHLVSLETPLSAAKAVLYQEKSIAPLARPVSETVTVAKKDLKAGEVIDGIGKFTVYGSIEKAALAREKRLLPLGLAMNSKLKVNVKQGELITYDMVEIDQESIIYSLRKLQDELLS